MLDAYIIDRIHQKNENTQEHRQRVENQHYRPEKRSKSEKSEESTRGIAVIDFTI